MSVKFPLGIFVILAAAVLATGGLEIAEYEFRKQSDWGAGFVGEFQLINRGEDPIRDWTLEFDLPADIGNLWGAVIVGKKGTRYRLKPETWSKTISPGGGRITVGFQAAPGNIVAPEKIVFRPVIAGLPRNEDNAKSSNGEIAPIFKEGPDKQLSEGDSEVFYRVVSDWGSGFQGEVTIINKGSNPIENWQVDLDLPGTRLTGLWNARISGVEGSKITIDASPYEWNRTIPPSGTVRFGFLGSPGGILTPPAYLALRSKSEPPVLKPFPAPTLGPDIRQEIPPSPPETINYAEALQKSLYFYDAQRSGPLPPDFRVKWRKSSGMQDGMDAGLDLTGGFYDAGDGMKFAFPMAASQTLLAWGGIEFREGFEESGQMEHLLDTVRWGADWLMKAFPEDNVFYVQVGRPDFDHAFWGPPETRRMPRPSYRIDKEHPGSDVAAEAAASLAAASLLFREKDSRYASKCLDAAIRLYAFADQYRGNYSDSVPEARAHYGSGAGYEDELAWGAAWLYRATGRKDYLQKVETLLSRLLAERPLNRTHSWQEKLYGTLTLMALLTKDRSYKTKVKSWLDYWSAGYGGGGIATTPGKLAWMDQWGSLRYAANTAFLAMVYSLRVEDPGGRFESFARRQIDYILGKNPAGRSYMVGFGKNSPSKPHHRASHGSTSNDIREPRENRNILFGAMVGGPSAPDDNAYVDSRENYVTNEVALDYNAGLTGALARLVMEYGGQPLAEFPSQNDQ